MNENDESQYYYEFEKQLNLKSQKECWANVLLARDWSIVEKLTLQSCEITHDSIGVLLQFNWVNNIRLLNLGDNMIGNRGAKILVKIDLPNLNQLYLQKCGVKSEGFRHITKARWPNLQLFQLSYFSYSTIPQISYQKNDNVIELNGWAQNHKNNWKKLNKLYYYEKQFICFINFVVMQGVSADIQYQGWFRNGFFQKQSRILRQKKRKINSASRF